jgi:hypothetical protein
VISSAKSATGIVLAHLAISIVHGAAHQELHIELDTLQKLFVLVIITICPLAAMVLLWTRYQRAGALLLAFSMFGSLVFGVWNHFVVAGPDHVTAVSSLFGATAVLLAVTEAGGISVGLAALRR